MSPIETGELAFVGDWLASKKNCNGVRLILCGNDVTRYDIS